MPYLNIYLYAQFKIFIQYKYIFRIFTIIIIIFLDILNYSPLNLENKIYYYFCKQKKIITILSSHDMLIQTLSVIDEDPFPYLVKIPSLIFSSASTIHH